MEYHWDRCNFLPVKSMKCERKLPAYVAHDWRAMLFPIVFLTAQGAFAHNPAQFALDPGVNVLEVGPHPQPVDKLSSALGTDVGLLKWLSVLLLVVPDKKIEQLNTSSLLKHKTVSLSPEAVVKSCKTSVTVGLIAPIASGDEFTKKTHRKRETIKKHSSVTHYQVPTNWKGNNLDVFWSRKTIPNSQ